MYENRIREYRLQKGMNLEELARKVGISVGYLCHLEKGTRTNPSLQIMGNIANILGKNVAEIFFDGSKKEI